MSNEEFQKVSFREVDDDIVRIPPVRVAQAKTVDSKSVSNHDYLLNRVIFEDDELLIINKPSGLAVHSGSGLQFGIIELLRELTNYKYLELVHRLDRATSGCLMLAKKRSALTTMNTMFAANNQKNNLLDKRYQALVMNGLKNPSEMVIEPLLKRSVGSGEHKMVVDEEGQYSKTRFHTIKTFPNASLLEAKLFTGRTHQVRVHARHLGCPLAGDDKYGETAFNKEMQKFGLNRLFLHASHLSFPHPSKQEKMTVKAPLQLTLEALSSQ